MRVLYLMYPTSANIITCSTYAWSRYFIKELVDRGHYVYWCCPKRVAKDVFEKEPHFVDRPGIHWFDVDTMPALKVRTHYYLTTLEDKICEAFTQQKGGKFFYDVIVTDRVLATAYLRMKLFLPYPKTPAATLPPIYNAFHYIFSPKNSPGGAGYWHYEVAAAAGMVGAYNLFGGKAEEDMVKHSVRRWMSPDVVRTVFSKKRKLPYLSWFTLDSLDPYRLSLEERRKVRPFTFNYAHAETELYKFPKFIQRVAKMAARGRDMRLLITATTSLKNYESIERHHLTWPGVDHYSGLPRLEFYSKLRGAHAFFCERRSGEVNPSNLEQIYLGLIPILPNLPWARQIVPEGYPYIYDNPGELERMIREVQSTYYTNPAYPELVHSCQEHVRRFDSTTLTAQIVDHMESRVLELINTKSYPNLVKFMNRALEEEGITELPTYEDWRNFIKTRADKRDGGGLDISDLAVTRYFASRFIFYWRMKYMGWIDKCDGPMPAWEYSGEPKCTQV